MSNLHTREYWKENPPAEKWQLVDVYAPNGHMFAIGRVLGVRPDEENLRHVVEVEVSTREGVEIMPFDGNVFQFIRHVGFLGRGL